MWFDLVFILNELLKLLNLWWQDQSTFIVLAIEVGDSTCFVFFIVITIEKRLSSDILFKYSLMILEWRVSQKNLYFIRLLLFSKKKVGNYFEKTLTAPKTRFINFPLCQGHCWWPYWSWRCDLYALFQIPFPSESKDKKVRFFYNIDWLTWLRLESWVRLGQ